MTAPQPARDSRVVEQFAARILYAMDEGADDDAVFQETGDDPLIGYIMNATIDYRVAAQKLLSIPGYLVLDPNSEALVERIADAIRLAAVAGLIQSDSLARAVLAALAAPLSSGETPVLGRLYRNPISGTVFRRVEGGYNPVSFGHRNEPAVGGQLTYLYPDGEGRTGPLVPVEDEQ